MTNRTSDATALRLQLRAAGFSPLAAEGKVPPMDGWSQKFDATDDEIRLWPKTWHFAGNTGVVAKFCPGLDIDITMPYPAEAVETLAREFFEEHGDIHVRFGKPPRRLIPLRTDEPFPKLVRMLTAPDGSAQKVEILGDGQQYIVAGIHPETKRPYRWHGGELETIRREHLPYVRREDMERFLDEAVQLLVTEFGFTDQSGAQKANDGERHERADTPWRDLNERALEHLDEWVPKLFPTAKKTTIGYRVKSADLGRGREEDLSLTTKGVKYFGDADMGDPKQGRRSAIDVVMEWNHLEFADAVRWLEQALDQPAPQEPSPAEEPPPQKPPEEPQPKPKSHRFKLEPFANITVPNTPNYLVKEILPDSGLAVCWGAPKSGKSFFCFDLVMHVAIGRDYRGHKVRQGSVVYLALEGGSGFRRRVAAWRKHCLGDHDQAVPFFLVDVSLNLIADHHQLIADIAGQLQDRPAVIVIDTLNRSLPGSESKDEDMGAYIRAADAVRCAFNCLVLIVHHCGIATNRPRGHTSLAGADDCQIQVERDKDGIVTATVEHAKDFEAGATLACKLERVELGNDTEGDPLSSCIIIPTDGGSAGPKLSKITSLAFDLLKRLLAARGEDPPGDFDLPPGYRVVKQVAWREAFYAAHPSEKPGTKQKAFVRAHLDLYEQHLIEFVAEFVGLWPDKPDI